MRDQALLVSAFDTIRKVATVTSKKEKEKLLQEGGSEYLRSLLVAAYDRYQTYRIQQIEQPDKYNVAQPDTLEEFLDLCRLLASHTIGTNESKDRIKRFLATNSREGAEIFTNILLRDLRCGIDEKTCNKVFPGLIPVFSIQLGYALDTWDRVTFPVCCDEKIDGIRCVSVYDGERVKFFSRNGHEFESGMDAFAEQIGQLCPGMPFVLDGEFVAFKFNENDPVCRKYRDGNWQFEYAKAMNNRKPISADEIRGHFMLRVWDLIDYDWFTSQGTRGARVPLEKRKTQLYGLFNRRELTFPNLDLVDSYVMHSKEQVLAYMKLLKGRGKEGCMLKPLHLPYSFSKNYTIMKLKHFVEGDFRIVDAYEGEKGKKYEGLLGGIVIATDDGRLRSNLGSGFTDEERCELWVEHLAGRLAGRIVEVQLKDITADGSLQLPTLLRFRDDKNSTDSYDEIVAKLKGDGE